jgi:hypothetical protein
VKATVPVGVVGAVEVSVTVAIHVAGVLTVTEPGEHESVVVVGFSASGVTLTVVWPVLAACVVSPP